MTEIMTKKNPPTASTRRFYFDKNIFDEGWVDPTIPVEPPPPIFSQQEHESAQAQAFERGRQQGLKEAAESRAQAIAQTISRISTDMARLHAAEDAREKVFEEEALRLTAAVLEKLFPALEAKYGMDELKAVMADVIQKHEGQSEILVEVHAGDLEEIRQELEKQAGEALRYTIQAREGLASFACRVTWKDGGATRDSQALAGQIAAAIEEMLAARGRSVHDRDKGQNPDMSGNNG